MKPYFLKNGQYKNLYKKQILSIKIWLLETIFTPTFLTILTSIDVINNFLIEKRFQRLLHIFIRLISNFHFSRQRVPQRYYLFWRLFFICSLLAKLWYVNINVLSCVSRFAVAIWSREKAGEKLYFHFGKNKIAFKSSRWRTDKIR